MFFIIFLFIYLFIYLFRAANFMHNINIIHRSFSPTALFPCLAGCLSFSLPCPACFLALPIFLTCPFLCLLPMPTSFCLFLLPIPFSFAFCLFIPLFFFRIYIYKSAYCTGNISRLLINTLKSVCMCVCNSSVDKLTFLLIFVLLLSKAFKI